MGNTSSRQSYDIYAGVIGVKYSYRNEKCNATASMNGLYTETSLSGYKIRDTYPQGSLYGSYSPNQWNQVQLDYGFGCNLNGVSAKTPAL